MVASSQQKTCKWNALSSESYAARRRETEFLVPEDAEVSYMSKDLYLDDDLGGRCSCWNQRKSERKAQCNCEGRRKAASKELKS